MKITAFTISVLLCAGVGTVAAAQEVTIKAVGTWGNLSTYQKFEGPFWNQQIEAASGGEIKGEAIPLTELGLSGFDIMRLLKLGVFDYAHGVTGYVASEAPAIEGADLAGVAQDIDTEHAIANAYFPVLAKIFKRIYNAKLMQLYPFPSQMLFCSKPINSIDDLAGKKIRVYSATLGDFVNAVGGVSVTVPFAEVVPALERGVVDCGITGTLPAYQAKWGQVAKYAYSLRVGFGLAFGAMNMDKWNSLTDDQRALLTKEINGLTDRIWKATANEDKVALQCLTTNNCPLGKPGGMTLVKPSEADLAKLRKMTKNVIIPRWAKRCGKACVDAWNATAGKVVSIQAAD